MEELDAVRAYRENVNAKDHDGDGNAVEAYADAAIEAMESEVKALLLDWQKRQDEYEGYIEGYRSSAAAQATLIFELRAMRDKAIDKLRKSVEDLAAAEERVRELEEELREVVDANYGMSFHHIGDGDGIGMEMADRIRARLTAPEPK